MASSTYPTRTPDVSSRRGAHRTTAAGKLPSRESDLLLARAEPRDAPLLRVLAAERSEEIFPVLLEEVAGLGFPRALILKANFEAGELRPAASLNCRRGDTEQFRSSLWLRQNPVNSVVQKFAPALVPAPGKKGERYYACPMVCRSASRCLEADAGREECLALRNYRGADPLSAEEPVCGACGIRGYAAVLLAEVDGSESKRHLRECWTLVERSNRYLTRLVKTEHYLERLRGMEMTVSRLGAVMQSMADPVILTDPQHRVVMQNRAAERFFRVPEGIGEGGRRAVELNNLLFSAALSSMVVGGASRDLTLVDVMEGEEVLFEAVCAPTFGYQGERTGMVTVMRNITDLRRADMEVRANLDKLRVAEEVVRQDRDRLNLIIENVGDPIIVADNSAKIVLLDSLAKQLLGLEEQYRSPDTVKNEAKLDAYLTSFTFSFAEKDDRSMRLYNPAAQAEIEYAARSGKIYDARAQVAYTVTVLRDFSAWKKLEQLELERRMLEMEKFAATGRLAGTIAHEINNPLEAIKNAIHLLGDEIPPGRAPLFDVLKNETERVRRIVRQMLGLYRSGAARLDLFELNGVIEDTLALFAGGLAKSKIAVDKRLGNLPRMRGSGDQFRQLLSNLVVNARDAMPSGGRLILRTREIRTCDGLQRAVSLVVSDTGSGIAHELQKTMWDPFISTKGEKGTGLGLWIVKGIVETHNGRIHVRSVVGKGTLIRIVFPVSG